MNDALPFIVQSVVSVSTLQVVSACGQCLWSVLVRDMQVEMFAVTADKTGSESDDALSDFVNIQQHLFEQLGLHFRFALSELDWLTF